MPNEHLATYLNDHLAGSVLALELLETLAAAHADTPLGSYFNKLKSEIAADRQTLTDFMGRLEISESKTRKVSAWFAEKLTELKLRMDDPAAGELRLFESLEALSLGIEGKRSLWLALAALSRETPALPAMNYEVLLARAREQRDGVESLRLEVALRALAITAPT